VAKLRLFFEAARPQMIPPPDWQNRHWQNGLRASLAFSVFIL